MSRYQVVKNGTDYHLGRRTALNEVREELEMRRQQEEAAHYAMDGSSSLLHAYNEILLALDDLFYKEVPFMVDKKSLNK